MQKSPQIQFCLTHNHGVVWDMDWCPSGCFNLEEQEDSLKRLGIVALACSDGDIPVYVVSLQDSEDDSALKYYETKPIVTLKMGYPIEQNLGLWKYQATKVVWSKNLGHNIIAGAYTNGIVCLWNLNSKSPLLNHEENGRKILTPYHIFKAHEGPITVLHLQTTEGGKKWLLTGSIDKSSKYWDLEDTTYPNTIHTRTIVTSGCWFNNWLTSYLGYDDILSYSHTCSTLQSQRDYTYNQHSIVPSNCIVMCISGCDWGNQVAQGNKAGELIAFFPHQLLLSCDSDKTFKLKRFMIGYNELVDKNVAPEERVNKLKQKEGDLKKINLEMDDKDEKAMLKILMTRERIPFEEEERTYEEAENRYGMVFMHFRLDRGRPTLPKVQEWLRQAPNLHKAPVEMYPLTQINRVAWNNNDKSFLYLASGYNAGFVRVQCVRFMSLQNYEQ